MAFVAKEPSRLLVWLTMPLGIALVAGLSGALRSLDRDSQTVVAVTIATLGAAAALWWGFRPAPKAKPPRHGEGCECRDCRRQRVLYGP